MLRQLALRFNPLWGAAAAGSTIAAASGLGLAHQEAEQQQGGQQQPQNQQQQQQQKQQGPRSILPFGPVLAYAEKDPSVVPRSPYALNPGEFKAFKLTAKEKLTRDTYKYRFELPDNAMSGLTVASCLVTKATVPDKDGKPAVVVRPYTPVTTPQTRGHMDLVVKVYKDGKMSKHMDGLKVGDSLEFKGPITKLPYTANMKKAIGLVAGGTGITPMLQVIDAVLSNPEDQTKLSLVYANRTPKDIILKQQIDQLAKQHPDRFQVFYVVDRPGWFGLFWRGGRGFVTDDVLRKHLPSPDQDALIMVCGPPGMMKSVCGEKAKDYSQGELLGSLKNLGFKPLQVFKF